jgi:chaperone BCS1
MIYILNPASADDSILNELFAKLPQRYVILLEDVDVASQNRSLDKEAEHPDSMFSFQARENK